MTIRTYQFHVQTLVTASSLNFTVSQALGLTSEATDGVRRDVEQDVGLVQAATWILQPSNGDQIEQELNLTQTAYAQGYETASNELAMSSSVTVDILATKQAFNNLNLGNDVFFSYGIRNLSVETAMGLSSVVNRTFVESVTSFLTLGNFGERVFTPNNDLSLVSTAEWGYGFEVESELDLTSTAFVNKTLNQNISHTDVVSQACTYFIESPCNRLTFNRFHGEGGIEPLTKKLNYDNTFYLYSIDDGATITLRNPEMDDRQRFAFNRVNRNFFDGSPDIYADEDWATEQSQTYTLVAVGECVETIQNVHTFLQDNLGREIIIKDWKGVTWVVIVTNPGDLYTEDAEGFWTLNFDVQGEALDGEWFFSRLNLTPAVSRAGSIYNRSATHGSVVSDLVGRAYDVDGDPTDLTEADIVSQEVSYVIE